MLKAFKSLSKVLPYTCDGVFPFNAGFLSIASWLKTGCPFLSDLIFMYCPVLSCLRANPYFLARTSSEDVFVVGGFVSRSLKILFSVAGEVMLKRPAMSEIF